MLSPKLFSWGYPILLVPVYCLFGLNLTAMKFLTSLFLLFSLPVIYLTFRGRLKTTAVVMLAAMIALNPYFYAFKDRVRSDFPFMFFALLCVYLIQRFVIERDYLINDIASQTALGAVMFFAFFIRGNGIVLLPCLLLAQVVEGRKTRTDGSVDQAKALRRATPYFTFFILAAITKFLLPAGSGDYQDMSRFITLREGP